MKPTFVYPLDLDASLESNLIKDEIHALSSSDNNYRKLVPLKGPIYEKDLVIKLANGKVLTKGKDYYLSGKYLELPDIAAYPLYGYIVFLNRDIRGEVNLQYRTIGAQYILSHKFVLEYLVNTLVSPRYVRWPNVLEKLVAYAPDEHSQYWEDFLNTEAIASAIDGISDSIEENTQDEADNLFQPLIDRVNAVNAEVTRSAYKAHVDNKSNTHNVNNVQLDALGRHESAVDSIKVFGKSLFELAEYIYNAGITQNDLDLYVSRFGASAITKTIVMKDGVATIRNSNGSATLDLSSGNIKIRATNALFLQADQKAKNNNKRATLKAGENILEITTSLNSIQTTKARYNGYDLITPDNLMDFIRSPEAIVEIKHTATDTTTPTGEGTEDKPYMVNPTPYLASLTKVGQTRVVDVTNSAATDCAISEAALYRIKLSADGKILKTQTINGHDMSQDRNLTKADIGLNLVDNVSDANAEMSNAFKAELTKYADKGHKHDFNTLGLEDANEESVGIAKYSNSKTDKTVAGSVITAPPCKEVSDRAATVIGDINTKMPIDVIDATQFGGNSYLPIPAVGAYEGSGFGSASAVHGEYEGNGELVLLRNGRDISTEGVFYSVAEVNTEGACSKYTPTTARYQPKFLKSGTHFRYIGRGTRGVFIGVDSNNAQWVILTNGTMDSNQHQGAIITSRPDSANFSQETSWIISNGYVYAVRFHIQYDGYYVELSRCPVSDIVNKDEVTFTPFHINGTKLDGTRVTDQARFNYATGISSDVSDANAVCHDISNGKWTGSRNIRHSDQTWELAEKDGVLRVLIMARGYFSNSTTSMSGNQWTESFTIDLTTREFARDTVGGFPFKLRENTLEVNGLEGSDSTGIVGGMPNCTAGTIYHPEAYCTWWFYGSQIIPRLYFHRPSDGTTNHFDHLNRNVTHNVHKNTVNFIGNFGSVANFNPSGITFLPDSRYALRQQDGSRIVCEYDVNTHYEGYEGIGPTNNRYKIAWNVLRDMRRVPYIWDGNVSRWKGAIFTKEDLVLKNTVEADDTLTGESRIAQSTMDSLRAACNSHVHATYGKTVLDDRIIVMSHPMTEIPVFAVYRYRCYVSGNSGTQYTYDMVIAFDVNNRENITSYTNLQYLNHYHSHSNVVGFAYTNGDAFSLGSQSQIVKCSDGNWWIHFACPEAVSYVGNTTGVGCHFFWRPATKDVQHFTTHSWMEYDPSNWTYSPDIGGCASYWRHASSTGLLATTRKLTVADWGTVLKSNICIHSTQVAQGWIIYVSEDMQYFINNTVYDIPKASIDLKAIYGDCKNSKFYIYIQRNQDGTYGYTTSRTLTPDSIALFYVGYAITGEQQITKLEMIRGSRIGEFKELTDHNADQNAHGLGSITKTDVELSLVENFMMSSSLTSGKRDLYATAKPFVDMYNTKQVAVLTGRITNGAQLPVPAGFSADDCRYALSLNYHQDTLAGITRFYQDINPNRTVSLKFGYLNGSGAEVITTAADARYLCVAVKH